MTTLEEGQHDQIKNERIRILLKIKVTQLVTEYQLEDLSGYGHVRPATYSNPSYNAYSIIHPH